MSYVKLANSLNGPNALLVNDPSTNNILKKLVLGFWPERKNDFFPAPQPVSLERRDLFKLKKFQYLACVKSDGMRFLMICFRSKDSVNKCYMADRAFRFYEVNQKFDDKVYTTDGSGGTPGSVFDGELIQTRNILGEQNWTYIIHDCINFCGENVSHKTFTERYECVDFFVLTCTTQDPKFTFNIQTKKFVKYSDLYKLVDLMSDEIGTDVDHINHHTDGIIFTPVNLGIGMHTQHTMFKWKPRELNTFDFKILETETDIIAQVNDQKTVKDFASVDKNTENGRTFLNKLKSIQDYTPGCIVECDYNEVTECYEPIIVRTCKNHPNGLYTVEKTHINIRENITIEELVRLSKN